MEESALEERGQAMMAASEGKSTIYHVEKADLRGFQWPVENILGTHEAIPALSLLPHPTQVTWKRH